MATRKSTGRLTLESVLTMLVLFGLFRGCAVMTQKDEVEQIKSAVPIDKKDTVRVVRSDAHNLYMVTRGGKNFGVSTVILSVSAGMPMPRPGDDVVVDFRNRKLLGVHVFSVYENLTLNKEATFMQRQK